MNATSSRRKQPEGESQPQIPQSTPGPVGNVDHSFTLQAVMELHKSVGEMNAKLDAVKGSVDGLKSKVDDLVTWKHRILGGAAMAGFFVAGLGFIVGKGWDYVSIKSPPGQAPAAQSTGQPAAAPAQSTPPTTPRPAGP